MQRIKLDRMLGFVMQALIVTIISISSVVYGDEVPSYGSFKAKIGDIKNAVNKYDPNSQAKLISMNIDSNIPAEVYCGEQYDLWVKTTGNYENEKGDKYNRKIAGQIILIDAPVFVVNEGETRGDIANYLLKAPLVEGTNEVKLIVKHEDITSEKVFLVKVFNRPGWVGKQYLALYGGSLGMFGLEANIYTEQVKTFLGGSIYFRKKTVSDAYIMATEVGIKVFTRKIFDKLYLFGGINVGVDTEGRSQVSPTASETRAYLGPNIGFKTTDWPCSIVSQIEWIVYGNENVALFKIGVGI